MAKKKKQASARRFLSGNRDLERKFAEQIAKTCADALGLLTEDTNRIAFGGYSVVPNPDDPDDWGKFEEQDKMFIVSLHLTDGFPALLPSVSREEASEYDKKYFAKMLEIRQQAGMDHEKWAVRDISQLHNGDMLLFCFRIFSVDAKRAKFGLSIAWGRDNDGYTHTEFAGIVDPEANTPLPLIYDVANDETEFLDFLATLLQTSMFDNWTTVRDLRIRAFLQISAENLKQSLPAWRISVQTLDAPGFALLLYTSDSIYTKKDLKDSQLRTNCLEIMGDPFHAGLSAAFISTCRKTSGFIQRMKGTFANFQYDCNSLAVLKCLTS